ncbi:MAG: HAD hydrolase family protein [FCB group bacterium]|nr:HAD hydrolase family protein [FCB group bacterium]
MTEQIKKRLAAIKLIISDVDGVLTDGTVIMGANGVEYKRFSITDGAGIAVARALGIRIAFISGRYSTATESRAKELNIEDVYNGTLNKIPPYEELKAKYNLTDADIAYVGDDLIDIPVMEKAGIAIAVRNAYQPVKKIAHYITEAKGGEGALREAIDWIIQSQGRYEEAIAVLKRRLVNE